jgi:hypothetical protein
MKRLISFPIGTAGNKVIVGVDNIATITFPTTSTMFIFYVGSATLKTTITFTTADATYASHNAVVKAISDAFAIGAFSKDNFAVYELPTLPIVSGTTQQVLTSVAYA